MSENTVSESSSHWCVLLPCSKDETWAIPQKCLAEIVTLPAETATPPEQFNWKGRDLSILDLGADESVSWRDEREGTGLVAVVLGLEGWGWEYCAVALRGEGLGMKDLAREPIEDTPDLVVEGAAAAFRIGDKIYQIPELRDLYKRKEQVLSAA